MVSILHMGNPHAGCCDRLSLSSHSWCHMRLASRWEAPPQTAAGTHGGKPLFPTWLLHRVAMATGQVEPNKALRMVPREKPSLS